MTDEEIIVIVKQCQTMAQAATLCGMAFNTFKRKAKQLGIYNINQGSKGCLKGHYSDRIKTQDILSGKYPYYQTYKLKIRLFEEGYLKDECPICGWNKKPDGSKFTPCELDHINRKSNRSQIRKFEIALSKLS